MPRLLILSDDGSERLVDLTERTMQIGRGPGNDIVLADASQGVSRTHAELRFRNGRCVIVDLQSQNGTWLKGQRVQHAEVPEDAEITIGNYRLRVLSDEKARAAANGPSAIRAAAQTETDYRFVEPAAETSLDDVVLVRTLGKAGWQQSRSGDSDSVQTWLLAGFVVAVAALAWMTFMPRTNPVDAASADATSPTGDSGATAPISGGAAAAGTDRLITNPTVPAPDVALPVPYDADRPDRAARPNQVRRPAVAVRPNGSPVVQRPGESAEAYRARSAAFHTRYVYSRAALDRGDFAAAAGGFEAILREEPGYMDVPQLLLRAQAGLRAAALDLYETGQRLENAGEWLGALQRYDQARQVHADVSGLPQATRRVREKLRVAGSTAFTRARQLDARGLPAEALKEYEHAVQWLPPDDPNRELATTRIDQLRRTVQ